MKVDYLSDLHLDFHVKVNSNNEKWQKRTEDFIDNLLPYVLGEVIIVAGDISHYNIQSNWALSHLSKMYARVICVFGNHDYYLVSNNQSRKYCANSFNRVSELLSHVGLEDNIIFLEKFNVYEYNGYTFSGATNWYPLHKLEDKQFFKTYSNDSVMITHKIPELMRKYEIEGYSKLQEVDVLITHVPPVLVESHHLYSVTSCYLSELPSIKAKHVVFGHCHEQNTHTKGDINFYINAIGYPMDWAKFINYDNYTKDAYDNLKKSWFKVKSFNI